MNISDLDKIIEQEAGVSICPICGVPFKKRHHRQVTCGSPMCKKAHRAKYMRERKERMMEEDIDMWRYKRATAQRKSRRKKKKLLTADENYQRAQEYWERFEQRHHTDKPDGRGYAERQIEKTLAQVPKIDVSGFKRKDGAE